MKFLSDRFRSYCKAAKDFCVYKVMHADDPPHRLALGIAIGIFVTFLPLIGIQMVVSFSLAWLCRANKVVGVPLVWISNPLTMVPIYYPCYALGCRLLNSSTDEWQQVYPNFIALFDEPAASWAEIFSFCWQHLLGFVTPLFLGSFIVATVLGITSYYVSLLAIRAYRLRRFGQLMPPSVTPKESIEDDQVAEVQTKGENPLNRSSSEDLPIAANSEPSPSAINSVDGPSAGEQQITN